MRENVKSIAVVRENHNSRRIKYNRNRFKD